ncbi:hypothetical protein SAMN04487897_10932 [Paenibacillus sp. yr247]|uniref:SAF domain-containing protein n=1 Tax=Paenibacillus sp. yr247 TaxID=1761880 RepID=UPI000889210E|nr:SAF domain-containing protein [Paenibacillus sp. yr247]SDO15592.1 hypothetical protein SAMN04487897_10932 [Paenibacillus sp. yr247]
MKVRVTVLFTVGLSIFFIGLFLFLLLYIKGEELLPKEVTYIPRGKAIEKYTEITNKAMFDQLFQPQQVLRAAIEPSMITQDRIQEVIGKTLAQPVYPDEHLTTHHIGDNQLVPKAGEIGYPIPSEWFAVLDWTGRVGDVGEIWLTPDDKLKAKYQQASGEINGAVIGAQANNQTNFNAHVTVKADGGNVPDLPERPLKKPLLTSVKLRYVFDAQAKAVKNAKDVADRSEGTNKPANAKIFLTADQFAQIKSAVEDGYKLIFAIHDDGERGLSN